MSVEDSLFDIREVKKVLFEQYGINVAKVKRINRGSANIYEIYSDDAHYIMKEFQRKINMENVQTEYNVVNHLKKYEINTPEYCLNKSGEICFNHKNKMVILQKYIEGNVLETNKSTKEQIIESINLLGKIIKALEDYEYELPYFKRYIMTQKLCDKDIFNIEQLILKTNNTEVKEILNEKRGILLKLRNLNFDWQDKLTIKKSHGDFTVSQFIYDKENKINAILDFVATRNIPVAREIIRNYFFMAKEIKKQKIDFKFFLEYVKEFMKIYELNYYDLQYMPLLYLIELSRTVYGYEQFINNNSAEYLKLGNQLYNQCKCLEKNYQELSERLIKLKNRRNQ